MKLKPCPFCGEQKSLSCKNDYNRTSMFRYFIYCPECNAEGPARDTKRKAVNNWNKRYGETKE